MANRKYSTVSCHKTKSAAKKKQKAMHSSGITATVVASGKKWCVKSAGKKLKTKNKKN